MSVTPNQLQRYLDKLLNSESISDYCPNGLQIEANDKKINTIVSGVTASLALINQAIKEKADALLVHHGFFFKGEPEALTSWKFQRIEKLIKHNICLFAYHLPLDIHPVYGNNAQLAKGLSFDIIDNFDTGTTPALGIITKAKTPFSAEKLALHIEQTLKRKPLLIESDYAPKQIETIGICTGGAQDFISYAKKSNLDAYISGEISERTTHLARELGIHYFACGHHATERYGVKALGEHLSQAFNIQHKFIDIDNPA